MKGLSRKWLDKMHRHWLISVAHRKLFARKRAKRLHRRMGWL